MEENGQDKLTQALSRERAAIRAAERAAQLQDTLLATVSHELRTPLNTIVGWVHVLRTGALTRAERVRALDAIDRNARVQLRLVADLLDEASLSQGRVGLAVRACDLEVVVRNAMSTLTPAVAARRLLVDMSFANGGLSVRADEARLRQVVWNLVSNAVKFTPAGGRVRIETVRADGQANVRVSDTGEGIEPDFLPFVFDAFRQAPASSKRAGFGLGLALVRQIVELHGGQVDAASPGKGRGATFTVSLPIAADPDDGLSRSDHQQSDARNQARSASDRRDR
jgi:signal transduction histidine kinase